MRKFQIIRQWLWLVKGGAVTSWLVHSSSEQAVRVQSPAGDTVLCSWARHLTLTVPLSTQENKWVPANCWGNLTNCGGMTCNGLASSPGGVEILLAASCYRNRDKLRQLWSSRIQGFIFYGLLKTIDDLSRESKTSCYSLCSDNKMIVLSINWQQWVTSTFNSSCVQCL